jgi:hypothetical protein
VSLIDNSCLLSAALSCIDLATTFLAADFFYKSRLLGSFLDAVDSMSSAGKTVVSDFIVVITFIFSLSKKALGEARLQLFYWRILPYSRVAHLEF